MTSKEIELILKAKLDVGDAATSAKTVGGEIAKALSEAFNGVGAQIADKILTELSQKITGQRLREITQQGIAGAPAPQPAGGVTPPPPSATGPTAGPATGAHPFGYNSYAYGGADRFDKLGANEQAKFQYYDRLKVNNITPFDSKFDGPLNEQDRHRSYNVAREHDATLNEFEARRMMKKINPNFDVGGGGFKEKLNSTASYLTQSATQDGNRLLELIQHLKELDQTLQGNNKLLESAKSKKPEERTQEESTMLRMEQQAKAEREEMNRIRQHQNDAAGVLKAKGMLDAEEESSKAVMKSNILKGVGGAATAMAFMGRVPSEIRRMNIAGAQLDNYGNFAYGRGDSDNVLATQMAGGEASMRERAQSQQNWTNGATIVGGAVAGAWAGGQLGSVIGPWGTAAGAAIGGGLGAYRAYTHNDAGVKEKMDEMAREQMGMNEDVFRMHNRGKGAATGAFRTAQRGIGATEGASLLVGGGDIGQMFANSHTASHRMEINQRKLDSYRDIQKRDPGFLNENGHERMTVLENAIKRDQGIRSTAMAGYNDALKMNQYDPLTGKAANLRQFAANRGLDGDVFEGTMGKLASTMGGFHFGGKSELESGKYTTQMGQLLNVQAKGLTNAPEIAGSLFQGGRSRGDSMKETAEIFENAVAAGLDKAQVGKAMQVMANEAVQSRGAGQAAEANFNRSLAGAQALAGPDGKFGAPEMNFSQSLQQGLQGIGSGKNGPDQVFGMKATTDAYKDIQKMKGNEKLKGMGMPELYLMQTLAAKGDEKGFKAYLDEHHKGQYDEKNLPEMYKMMQSKDMRIPGIMDKMVGKDQRQMYMADRGLTKDLGEVHDAAAVAAALAAGTDPTQNPNYKKGAPADPTQTVGGKNVQNEAQKDAVEVMKGISTLSVTFGQLDTSLKNLITRANNVISDDFMKKTFNVGDSKNKNSTGKPGK